MFVPRREAAPGRAQQTRGFVSLACGEEQALLQEIVSAERHGWWRASTYVRGRLQRSVLLVEEARVGRRARSDVLWCPAQGSDGKTIELQGVLDGGSCATLCV